MSGKKVKRFKIIYIRTACVIFVSLLFILSYRLDVQVLEGSLTGSRFLGLHLADPFIAAETFANHFAMTVNLAIGFITICICYFLAGGRAFCSWVCLYGLLSEWGEYLSKFLIKKGVIKKRKDIIFPSLKYWFLALWLGLSFATGYLVFETVNLMAITSRMVIYGASFACILIFISLLAEIFFARRFWCLYVCPVGATYGLLNKISLGRIEWTRQGCGKCGACIEACYDKSVLGFIENGDEESIQKIPVTGSGCTFCNRCIDACPKGSLAYSNRLKNIV